MLNPGVSATVPTSGRHLCSLGHASQSRVETPRVGFILVLTQLSEDLGACVVLMSLPILTLLKGAWGL